jgi:phosphoenolpyruvate carboxylase
VEELSRTDPDRARLLPAMYEQWPFFRATIDNAALALAKTDLKIAERYAALAGDDPELGTVAELIEAEFRRSVQAVREITQQAELLDDIPWLKESIRYRNRYIDPLNLIQVELLRRLREVDPARDEHAYEELRHLTHLTIKGLAAGMRTTG